MKVAYLAVVMIVALSMVALAVSPTNVAPIKPNVVSGVAHPTGRPGGETIATATVIPALPFSDAGNTCDFVDDYDEVCPYTGSTSPDCVYAFTPGADVMVDIFLCMSMYDTKVFVYEDAHTPGAPYACNDDNGACGDYNTYMYQSWLTEIAFYAGHTYYIVIDGYGGDCGNYVVDVYEVEPCVVECPPESLLEGEVDCYPNYVDDFNGGLNSTPPVYSHVDCDNETIVICGTSGVFPFASTTYRDTDWYMLDVEVAGTITIGVEAEFGALMGFVDLAGGAFYVSTTTPSCTYATLSYSVPVGPTVVFVSTDSWNTDYVCGSDYYLTIEGYECTSAVEEASWGSIKALYR